MNKIIIIFTCLLGFCCAERDPFATVTAVPAPSETFSIKNYALTYKSAESVSAILEHLYPGILVGYDKEAQRLLVKATAAQHISIKEQLRTLDQPLPQVLIEVQAIELNNNALQDLGIRWYMQAQIKISTNDEIEKILERLRLLVGQGKGSLKAAPKITATLGTPAIIHIGDKVPYTVPVEHGQNTTYDINYLDAGVILNILPEYISTSSIVLSVQPKINSIKQWKQTVGGEYPVLSSREVATTVHIRDNESFIIGGLLNQEEQQSIQKVPILGDIPFLGFLFQHTTQEKVTSDTVFIVTAKRI